MVLLAEYKVLGPDGSDGTMSSFGLSGGKMSNCNFLCLAQVDIYVSRWGNIASGKSESLMVH